MGLLVEVRPIEMKKWHGKEGKDDFSMPKSLEVLYDEETGGYATGLTDEEQKKLEKQTGLNLSKQFDPSTPHKYWSSVAAKIKLPNHKIIFNMDNPLEYIKVKNLKAIRFVANSLKEYNDGKFPDATHVIFDESEEVAIKASKIQRKNKCISLAIEMSADEKANLVQILADKGVRGKKSDFIDVEIDRIIEEKPNEFLKFAKMDKNEVYTRAAVLEAIHRNVLNKEGTSIFYMGDKLGFNVEEAIQWFLDPQNQQMKIAILEKLA